jgi:hypothetical protein
MLALLICGSSERRDLHAGTDVVIDIAMIFKRLVVGITIPNKPPILGGLPFLLSDVSYCFFKVFVDRISKSLLTEFPSLC